VSAAEHAQALLARHRGRLRWTQALVIACAEHDSVPLDLYRPDDAAVICRAEKLALGGTPIRVAIQTAREELKASRLGQSAHAVCRVVPFGRELRAAPASAVCGEPTHTGLWGARDGNGPTTRPHIAARTPWRGTA
jgi:hypothetical protein